MIPVMAMAPPSRLDSVLPASRGGRFSVSLLGACRVEHVSSGYATPSTPKYLVHVFGCRAKILGLALDVRTRLRGVSAVHAQGQI